MWRQALATGGTEIRLPHVVTCVVVRSACLDLVAAGGGSAGGRARGAMPGDQGSPLHFWQRARGAMPGDQGSPMHICVGPGGRGVGGRALGSVSGAFLVRRRRLGFRCCLWDFGQAPRLLCLAGRTACMLRRPVCLGTSGCDRTFVASGAFGGANGTTVLRLVCLVLPGGKAGSPRFPDAFFASGPGGNAG